MLCWFLLYNEANQLCCCCLVAKSCPTHCEPIDLYVSPWTCMRVHGLVREPMDLYSSVWTCMWACGLVNIYPLPLGPPFPPPLSYPSWSSQSTELSSLGYTAGSHKLAILPMVVCICRSPSPTSSPLPPATVFIFPFSAVSIPALQIGSSVPFSRFHIYALMWLPGGLSSKESACQCRRCRRCGFNPWAEIPWRRKWQPPPVFLPGEFHGRRSLEGSQRVRYWATGHTCGI